MAIAKQLSVVLYDRHAMCVESFAAGFDDSVRIVASTADLDRLADVVGEHQPDLCLVEVLGPDQALLEALRGLGACAPSIRIITLVDELPPGFVRETIAAGARGIVRRDSTLRILNDTIRRVAGGESLVGAHMLLRRGGRQARTTPRSFPTQHPVRLTEREHEVLERLMAGEDTRHIAAALMISRSTARTHVESIRLKLGAQTRLQVVAYASGVRPATPRHADPKVQLPCTPQLT